ncbi:MAG: DUF2066 domain-containing protein [Proteobacteria bacterium]|nr:DUF2066 domain-containing protein [Pseudomonadota bacterium]
MTRFLAAALLAFSLLFAIHVRADDAAPSAGGYSATVPVADTSDASRDKAIVAALTQVLAGLAPGITPGNDALAQATGYVRNYRYQRAAGGNGLQLQVDFDPGSLQRLVQQLGGKPAVAAGGPASAGTSAAPAAVGGNGTWWVEGIDNAGDFATMLASLQQSDQLHDVTPVAAQGDGVLLSLSWDAPLPDVLNALDSGGHFQTAPAHQGADASLHWTH